MYRQSDDVLYARNGKSYCSEGKHYNKNGIGSFFYRKSKITTQFFSFIFYQLHKKKLKRKKNKKNKKNENDCVYVELKEEKFKLKDLYDSKKTGKYKISYNFLNDYVDDSDTW